ncbi:MAG: DUF4468 domain-containing protein [Spirochaetota bacterium]|nr:DUF4468 domain-containing protein [Spirochaetota bacterium]
MKQTILLLISAAMLFGCASATTVMSEDPQVIEIIEVDASVSDIFRLSNEWMVETFNSAEAVIQYTDKEEGVLMGKGVSEIPVTLGSWRIGYTLKIETREGKARISIYDMTFAVKSGYEITEMGRLKYQEHWDRVKDDITAIADDYESHLKAGLDASW